jgi:LacI family transcriptional regulator
MAKGTSLTPSGHVNLRKLAEHLELSQTTVSLVLNNSPSAKSIPQETRDRVQEAAERLNYRPNYFARSLRQSRSMSVGVLAPDLSEGYFTRVMSGVVEELTRAHYFYFTACHDWKRELIEQYPRMLVERAVDGFLLLNTPADHISVPVPVVAISAHSVVKNVTNITLDHSSAVHQALTHLYELDATGWSMKTGYHPMAPEIGYKPMQALLEKSHDFTAIFCFNDISAIGAIRALKDAGLSVPGDVSVVGFDDIQSAAYSTPSLTTVRQPLAEMGTRGAQVLLERIANREMEYPSEIVMAPRLVVRESTGPVQSDAGRRNSIRRTTQTTG